MVTDNYLNPDKKLIVSLTFNENGYAYENNSIFKYPWKLHTSVGILELNHKEYKIVGYDENSIQLINVRTKIKSVMKRNASKP